MPRAYTETAEVDFSHKQSRLYCYSFTLKKQWEAQVSGSGRGLLQQLKSPRRGSPFYFASCSALLSLTTPEKWLIIHSATRIKHAPRRSAGAFGCYFC